MEWLCEPPSWSGDPETGVFEVCSGSKTDSWRRTHYGFIVDTSNFFHCRVTGDFVADVKFTGRYTDLYDQSGLMLRVDEENWIKTGIEFAEGSSVIKRGGLQASAVVTRGGHSDWSVVPLDAALLSNNDRWVSWRVKRAKEAVHISYSLDGEEYTVIRLAYLPETSSVLVGPFTASPQGAGFVSKFKDFKMTPLTE